MAGGNEKHKRLILGATLVFLSGACWSPVAVLGKICIESGVDAVMLNVVRMLMSVLFIGVAAAAKFRSGTSIPLSKGILSLLLGASVFALGGTFFFLALGYIDASLAYLVIYTYPVLVILLAALLGWEKLTMPKLFAVSLALIGVALVLRVETGNEGNLLHGVLLALVPMVFFANYVLISGRYLAGYSSTVVSFFTILGGAAAILAATLFTGIKLDAFSRSPHLLLLVAVTAIGSALQILFLIQGIRHIGVSWTSIIGGTKPVLVVLLAWAVLGEAMDLRQLAGMALIIFGVILMRSDKFS